MLAQALDGEQRLAGRSRRRRSSTSRKSHAEAFVVGQRHAGAHRWTAVASHTSARSATAEIARGAIVAAVGSGHVARPSPPNAPHPPLGDPWSAQAFGLALAGTLALESVVAATRAATRADTWLERAPRAAVDRRWREARPRTLLERRLVDGRVGLSVQADDDVGFRVWAPRHGCYLVAPDGRTRRRRAAGRAARGAGSASCSPRSCRWPRCCEAWTCSTPARSRSRGRAIAFLGGSGAGKTTLASRIVARGARLVTDDVLAVEVTGATVRAHRGGAVARIDPRELRGADALRAPRPSGRCGCAARSGTSRPPSPRRGFRSPSPTTWSAPPTGAASGSSPVRPYDPALLLGSAFLSYLTAPERLRRQLESCAAIARSAPLYQVRAGAGATSADVADAVLRHAEIALGERAP